MLKMERNRWACRADLKPRIRLSRCHVGWWEFSARLFSLLSRRCTVLGSISAHGANLTVPFGRVEGESSEDLWAGARAALGWQ